MRTKNRSHALPISAHWKINSNGYGGRILAFAVILVIVVPLGFYLCARILDLLEVKSFIPLFMMKISLVAGVVLVGLLSLLLAIEFIQDRILNTHYLKNIKYKLPLADGQYECQYCGARNIDALDTHCPVCGKEFQLQ